MAKLAPRPSEQYLPWRKCRILCQSWRKLQALDLLVVLLLFPLELCCWLLEKTLGLLRPWIHYQRLVTFLLFRFYFKNLTVLDPYGVLKGQLGRRLILCSNHPTGLLDRLLVQHLFPWCYCLTQNWFEYTNAIERCLHVTQGMSLDHLAKHLDHGALWVAVGGAREMHPHIRKVHTGAVRMAMQRGEVWLVPMHLAFEAHCQRGSDVLVELGEPLLVCKEDPDSSMGRVKVRSLTRDLEERLGPLTNWTPVPEMDFGKKGQRGAGETRQAIEEWYQVRAIDTLIFLQCLAAGHPRHLPWPQRVQRLRKALQRMNGLEQKVVQVRRFVEQLEGHLGRAIFRPPEGTFWDLPVTFKALPKAGVATVQRPPKLLELRNFTQGVHCYGGHRFDPELRLAWAELMELCKDMEALED